MNKYFVVSDIHGFYNEMITALVEAGFDYDDERHVFICCGDLFDRGPDALKCLRFVNKLPDERKILIRGNHEDLLMDLLNRGYYEWYDYHNRTDDTVRQLSVLENDDSYVYFDIKNNIELKQYYNSLHNYYEMGNYIFVHGYIPVIDNGSCPEYRPDWRNASYREFGDAAWLNGYEMYSCGIKETGKTIVCGHFHTSYGHHFLHGDGPEFGEGMNSNIFYEDGFIGLDACTVITGRVNVLVIEGE